MCSHFQVSLSEKGMTVLYLQRRRELRPGHMPKVRLIDFQGQILFWLIRSRGVKFLSMRTVGSQNITRFTYVNEL